MKFQNKYKILKHNYVWDYYTVYIKRWWFPGWWELWEEGHIFNTWPTLEEAEEFLNKHKGK